MFGMKLYGSRCQHVGGLCDGIEFWAVGIPRVVSGILFPSKRISTMDHVSVDPHMHALKYPNFRGIALGAA